MVKEGISGCAAYLYPQSERMKPKKDRLFKARPNFIYAIISEALMLFVVGLLALVLLKGTAWMQQYRENIDILVEIKQEVSKGAIRQLLSRLESDPLVLPASIKFISKEEGAALLREDFGEDFSNLGLPNPLYDVVTFNLPSAYLNRDSLDRIRQELLQIPAVHDIYYQDIFLDQAFSNLQKIRNFTLVLSVLLLLLSYHLIYNTVRLALYANRLLIKNMEMVGASWSFISRPYLRKAAWYGLASSLLAIGGILLVQEAAAAYLDIADLAAPDLPIVALYGSMLLLGTGVSVLSTYRVVRRYLQLRMNDLY